MIYIIDTHAWIEYLRGVQRGTILQKILESENHKVVTLDCCVAEIKGYCLRNKINFQVLYEVVKNNSFIFPVLLEHWLEAVNIKFEMRKKHKDFGLIDAILLAKQKEIGGKVVSGDPHFKRLKNVVYTGK